MLLITGVITGFLRVTSLLDNRRLLFKESEKSVWLHW